MQDIDYENLFIYMSLIFAISIFVILLYGCAFTNGKAQFNIFENFLGEEDMKSKVLSILRKNKEEIKDKEDKKKVADIIEKIETGAIDISDIKLLIDQLKGLEKYDNMPKEAIVSGKSDKSGKSGKSGKSDKPDDLEDDSEDVAKDSKSTGKRILDRVTTAKINIDKD